MILLGISPLPRSILLVIPLVLFAIILLLQATDRARFQVYGGLTSPASSAAHAYKEAYHRIGYESLTREDYLSRLDDFAADLPSVVRPAFQRSLAVVRASSLGRVGQGVETSSQLGAMVDSKNVWQTDQAKSDETEDTRSWQELNPNWAYHFHTDIDNDAFIEKYFARSAISWAWSFMNRGVLKADFVRYLLVLVHGGVYADVDTRCMKPVDEWGKTAPDTYSGIPAVGEPSVIVGVDVDVHDFAGWEKFWPRPIGICQWTLSAAPSHPILLDVSRRIVDSTRQVEAWEVSRAEKIAALKEAKEPGWEEEVKKLEGLNRTKNAVSVMEWTGPAIFTDSVMAYLYFQYGVSWRALHSIKRPLRIGDVLVLPITGLSPGGEPDFRSGELGSPQNVVVHDFRGGWKNWSLDDL